MSYLDELHGLTEPVVAQVVEAVEAWQAGHISLDELAALVASLIASAETSAAILADLSLAATLSVELGVAVAAIGIVRPPSDTDRLIKAVHTLAAIEDASPQRWERLARAEVQKAAADAYSEAIDRRPEVTGWTRGLDPDPCDLCKWWHRGGAVYRASTKMPTHTGCECVPIPVTK